MPRFANTLDLNTKHLISVRIKDLEAGGHWATGSPKAGGPTENSVAKIVFHHHKDVIRAKLLPQTVISNHTFALMQRHWHSRNSTRTAETTFANEVLIFA